MLHRPENTVMIEMRKEAEVSSHVYTGQEPRISRPARISPGWPGEPRKPGPILDKKKGLLVGREYQARLVWQHFKEGFKKPVADLFNKSVGQGKAASGCNKGIDKTASQVCQMLSQHLFFKVFHISRPINKK